MAEVPALCEGVKMLHYHDMFETENARVARYCMGAFAENTYILLCKGTKAAAVVDPGGEVETLVKALESESAVVTHLIFTHCHIDHIYGAEGLKAAYPGAKVCYHAQEKAVIEAIPDMCRMFNVPVGRMPACDVDLSTEAEFNVGRLQVRSIFTPGHTPGSVCFWIAEEKLCFTGDLLFKGSVGRTDFEGGSGTDLRSSLDRLLGVLPDDTHILPGHGKFTDLGSERRNNFYLRVDRWR